MEEERPAPQPRRRTRSEQLRAPTFSAGSVLGSGFAVWAKSLGTLLLLMLIVYAPVVLYKGLQLAGGVLPEDGGTTEWEVGEFLVEWLLGIVATAAVIHAVFQRLRGERAGVGDSLRRGMARLLPVLGASLLYAFIVFLPLLPGVALVFLGQPIAGVFLAVAGFVGAVYFSCMLWVTVPAVVVEQAGPVDALKRSVALTHGCKGNIFLVLLVTGAIGGFAGMVLGVVSLTSFTASVMLGLVITLLVGALTSTMNAVGYHDLRLAKEGIGVEELLEVFE
ncbi:MAG: DUF6159 family protein [Planctomycetota bacterium]|jgi:hypothetical protein